MRTVVLAALSASVLLGSGCGGEESAVGGGAEVAPASSVVFISLNSDFEGDQWRQAQALVERFPAGRDAVDDLLGEIREDELDFERDVKPAVGPEVNFVLLDGEGEDFVVLTQPDDPAKFQEVVTKGDDPGVTREVEGWWAAAETDEVLNRFEAALEDGSLSGRDAFEDAMADLPEDALLRGYVNGEAFATGALTESGAGAQERALVDCFSGEGSFPGVGFAFSAEENGARVAGSAKTEGIEVPEDGSWDLVDAHVSGALGFFAARGLGEQLRKALECVSDADEDVARQIAQAELVVGVSITEDLLPLFDEETLFAVYPSSEPGGSAPFGGATFSLVSEVEDDKEALGTLDKIASRVTAFSDDVTVDDVTVGGVQAKRVTVSGEDLTIFYGVYGGKLVLTTSEEGIAVVADGAGANDAYEAARETAGAPDESGGLAWVDVPATAAFVTDLLFTPQGEDVPPDVEENLEPLRSVLFWSEGDDDRVRFEGFFQID